jgi:hypothetical protein
MREHEEVGLLFPHEMRSPDGSRYFLLIIASVLKYGLNLLKRLAELTASLYVLRPLFFPTLLHA